MKKHMRTHSYKDAVYKCDLCDFIGGDQIEMEVHLAKLHGDNFECGLIMIPVNWMAPQKILTCTTNNIIHTSPYFQKSEAGFNKTRYQKHLLTGLIGCWGRKTVMPISILAVRIILTFLL